MVSEFLTAREIHNPICTKADYYHERLQEGEPHCNISKRPQGYDRQSTGRYPMRLPVLFFTSLILWFAASAVGTTPAHAKVCKVGMVKAISFPSRLKTVARARSRIAWSRRARKRYGTKFDTFTLAREKSVTCQRIDPNKDRRWQCTRIARPCRGVGTLSQPLPKCARGTVIKFGGTLSTRSSARRSARSRWEGEAAERFGKAYGAWEKASNKALTCSPRGNRVRCRAAARACRI